MMETADARLSSLVIDGVLALDAGGLSSGLSSQDQQKLKAILLTHYHYDHIRDIPAIGMNFSVWGTVEIYSIPPVFEVLSSHLVNGKLYPNFLEWPRERPAIKFITIEPHRPIKIGEYNVLATPVSHSVPTVGYQVTSPDGKKVFYTGDTGVGLSACWEHVSPDLLVTEVSMPQMLEERAMEVGHLTPQLLRSELQQFLKLKGYLPPIIIIHINPYLEKETERELAEVAQELRANITVGREGMTIHL
jgi:phosphoribosyl 1,2-cyclic phosphodiesterase